MVDTAATPKIETRGLIKEYGKRRVVNKVDVHVHAGEIVGLLGPNGAGKTTTFYMVDDLTDLSMYRRARFGIGYLPQEASVFRKMTVEQNIRAIAETIPYDKAQRKACIEQHLEELGLTHLAEQKAYTLSGGERRRLEISRALVTNPKFLLMDEPFSGVDPISVNEVQKIIVQLKERGIGVLITDHNVRETLAIVDRAYLLHEGSILAEGSSEFLINDTKSREFYLGENFNM